MIGFGRSRRRRKSGSLVCDDDVSKRHEPSPATAASEAYLAVAIYDDCRQAEAMPSSWQVRHQQQSSSRKSASLPRGCVVVTTKRPPARLPHSRQRLNFHLYLAPTASALLRREADRETEKDRAREEKT